MELYGIGLIPLIMGVSEVLKKAGINEKFIPIVDLILGIGAGFLLSSNVKEAIVYGIFMGLSASGLYSGIKNVKQGMKGEWS